MEDLGFGLSITLAGMGTVFGLLLLLTGMLVLIGRLDQRSGSLEAPSVALTQPVAGPAGAAEGDAGAPEPAPGLDPRLVAAITVAVATHVREVRRQAGPVMRADPPVAFDHTGRWAATGRARQTRPWRRR